MKAHEWRYIAIGVLSSAGVMLLLDFFVHPFAGVAWIVAYCVAYRDYPTLHRLIERIAGGKEDT